MVAATNTSTLTPTKPIAAATVPSGWTPEQGGSEATGATFLGALLGRVRASSRGVLTALTLGPVLAFGQVPPVTIDGVEVATLANGIPLLLIADPGQKGEVSVAVCYGKGSSVEAQGQQGAAHALEHMKFRGTKKYPDAKGELAKRQAEMNGFTSTDRICYFENFASGKGYDTWALDFEADRAVNTQYPAEVFKKEQTAFLSELKMAFGRPEFALKQAVYGAAFTFHGYERMPIGNEADVANLNVETLQRLDKAVYQDPKNIVVAVAGTFNAEAIKAQANATFGVIPEYQGPALGTSKEPKQNGAKYVAVEGTDPTARLLSVYHGVAASHPMAMAQRAISALLTEEDGPLHKALVKSGLASQVYADPDELKEPGLLNFQVTLTEPKHQQAAERILAAVVEGLASGSTKLDAAALKRWKQGALLQHDRTLAERGLNLALKLAGSAVATGVPQAGLAERQLVEDLNAEQIQAFAQTFLVKQNRTMGVYLPTPEAKGEATAKAVDVDAVDPRLAQYQGRPGQEVKPLPQTRQQVEALIKAHQLSNGARVQFLPVENEGHFVQGSIVFGTADPEALWSSPADGVLASILGTVSKQSDSQEIRARLTELDASVTAWLSSSQPGGIEVNFDTRRENVPQVIALVGELLNQATFPEDRFKEVINTTKTNLEEQKSEGWLLLYDRLARKSGVAPDNDPRHPPTTEEQLLALKALTPAQLAQQWERFRSKGQLDIALAGDLSQDASVLSALEAAFGGWKNVPASTLSSFTPAADAALTNVIDTPGKPAAYVGFGRTVPIDDQHADYAPLRVVAEILGNFDGPAYHALRHSGATDTYAVMASFEHSPGMDHSTFQLAANTTPAKLKEAERLMTKLLQELKGDQRLLDDTKAESAKKLRALYASGDALASSLNYGLVHGWTLEYHEALDARIQQVTVDDLNRVIDKYLRSGLAVVSVADQKAVPSGR